MVPITNRHDGGSQQDGSPEFPGDLWPDDS